MKTCCEQYVTYLRTFWKSNCDNVEDDLNTRGVNWKYVFRTSGRLTFLSLHTCLEDYSSRLLFKTYMKMCCKQYSTYIRTFWRSNYGTVENDLVTSNRKGVNLGLPHVSKISFEVIKIWLQKDGSVNVFKSSYKSWRPVFETGPFSRLQTVYFAFIIILKQTVWLKCQNKHFIILLWVFVTKNIKNSEHDNVNRVTFMLHGSSSPSFKISDT